MNAILTSLALRSSDMLTQAEAITRTDPNRAEPARIQHSPSTIASWLEPADIVLDVELRNRRHALEWASEAIGRMRGLDPAPIFRALWRRELVGTTALGHGLAIPHARVDGIDRPLTLLVRPKSAIDFAAPDHKPVSTLLVIVVPSNGDVDDHLQLLALVAEMFSDATFRQLVASARDVAEVRRAFVEHARRVAPVPCTE